MQTLQDYTNQTTDTLVAVNDDLFEISEALRRSIMDSENDFLSNFYCSF